ncbi:MAG: hypothetical protein C0483_16020 [Pirellula sp.]|nr:hypothetical protein [Pirellula sp.]
MSRENPFSTRAVRPGAIAFLFEAGVDARSLVDRFLASGRRGQIVGPHGSGKSTLLASLAEELRARGIAVKLVELHDGCRAMPDEAVAQKGEVLMVDGYEQLGVVARSKLAFEVARRQAGLLVTSHRNVRWPIPLPVIYATHPGVELAERLALELLSRSRHPEAVSAAEIRGLYEAEQGNLREVFFRLYDLYESRSR